MQIEVITKEDLSKLKSELLEEIRLILRNKGFNFQHKEWLKSYEVRKLLGISTGTLQNMRLNGTIIFTKIGGLMYYRYEDIIRMMETNKPKNPFALKNNYDTTQKKWK
jgi:hypothetical protein